MAKISLTGIQARNKAIAGMSYVASAVKSTLGPFGQNFLLEKQNKITNDGYLISNELAPSIKDEFERRGALVALEGSSKTNDMVGDATSTAWALTEAIVKEAVRFLPNENSIKAKKTPSEIIKMINTAKDEVILVLKDVSTPITTKEALIKSALVSVEDEEIAELLGSMQWDLGAEGIIIAQEVNETETKIERVSGILLDNGFSATHMINNPEKGSLDVADIDVLLTNYTIGVEELKTLNTNVFSHLIMQKKWGVVLIARAFTADAIKKCQESIQAGFAIFPINAPYTNQSQMMHDIETVVGGRYIDVEESSLADVYVTDVGFIKSLSARSHDAVVTGEKNEASEARAVARIEELKKKREASGSDFEKKMFDSRIAQLANGFAILKVGSQSLADRKRLKDKCDDAVNAVRYALQGGTVAGAGQAFKDISDKMEEGNILKRPLRVIYDTIVSSAPDGWTIPEWVVDPYLVLKCALENSCSVAATMANIGGQVVEENPKKRKYEEDEQ
jgi:chaperonin GroEL